MLFFSTKPVVVNHSLMMGMQYRTLFEYFSEAVLDNASIFLFSSRKMTAMMLCGNTFLPTLPLRHCNAHRERWAWVFNITTELGLHDILHGFLPGKNGLKSVERVCTSVDGRGEEGFLL